MPCKKVIHTVGPIWRGGQFGEELLLKSCYQKSLELAKENNIHSMAFPLISAGAYGYPKGDALKVATNVIKEFLNSEDMEVYLVIYDQESFVLSTRMHYRVKKYIDDNYIAKKAEKANRVRTFSEVYDQIIYSGSLLHEDKKSDIEDLLGHLDESFSQMLFRLIDEKGMTDVECYKKANIDRKVFSKIRSSKDYKPSKTTAVAFALALELPLDQARRMIELAGYSLTHSNKFDVIIEYFIKAKKYDIFEINEVLFEFDQKLLGC